MKKLSLLLLSISAFVGMSFIPMGQAVYAQDSISAACEGVQVDGSTGNCKDGTSAVRLSNLIKIALQIFQGIVGVISVFVFILAGLNYITSGGDSSKTKTAKDRILYASIGLVVVVLAQIIIQFVLNRIK